MSVAASVAARSSGERDGRAERGVRRAGEQAVEADAGGVDGGGVGGDLGVGAGGLGLGAGDVEEGAGDDLPGAGELEDALADLLVLEVEGVAGGDGGVLDEGVADGEGEQLGLGLALGRAGAGLVAAGGGAAAQEAGGGDRLAQGQHDHRRLVDRPRAGERDLPDVEAERGACRLGLGVGEQRLAAHALGGGHEAGAAGEGDGDGVVDRQRGGEGEAVLEDSCGAGGRGDR
nr:hypothetical protein [Nannocystis sp.]